MAVVRLQHVSLYQTVGGGERLAEGVKNKVSVDFEGREIALCEDPNITKVECSYRSSETSFSNHFFSSFQLEYQ